jgi:hypothetical protein
MRVASDWQEVFEIPFNGFLSRRAAKWLIRTPEGQMGWFFMSSSALGELKKPKKQGRKPCQGGSEEPFSFYAQA